MNQVIEDLLEHRKEFINFCNESAEKYIEGSQTISEAVRKVREDFESLEHGVVTEFYEKGIILALKQKAYERPL